ncbi:unnamed protein product, partial [Trypanosoma congolense IL3000]
MFLCLYMNYTTFSMIDRSVSMRIKSLSPYREHKTGYKLYKTMKRTVDRLHAMGIISLHQWASAASVGEVESVDAHMKGELNAALLSARRNEETMRVGNALGGKEVDGVHDSVFNARWSYVMMSDEYSKKWLGMGVLLVSEGEQPHLWSEAQADVPYDPEEPWEGDEVPGVSGKLVMATLKS